MQFQYLDQKNIKVVFSCNVVTSVLFPVSESPSSTLAELCNHISFHLCKHFSCFPVCCNTLRSQKMKIIFVPWMDVDKGTTSNDIFMAWLNCRLKWAFCINDQGHKTWPRMASRSQDHRTSNSIIPYIFQEANFLYIWRCSTDSRSNLWALGGESINLSPSNLATMEQRRTMIYHRRGLLSSGCTSCYLHFVVLFSR